MGLFVEAVLVWRAAEGTAYDALELWSIDLAEDNEYF